ncbi:Fc.00g105880.m01.CDS01 [Cosmosporella sp. VM-42]
MDSTQEALCNHPTTTTQPQTGTDGRDLISVPPMDPKSIKDGSTLQSFVEADTSSEDAGPIALQRFSIVDSYLTDDASFMKYPHLGGSDSRVWASSDGVANFLQNSCFMLPRSTFLPYVQVFFERLYPVFPVVDREWLLTLLQSDEDEEQPLPAGLYSFLAALSAAVIVQLNVREIGAPDTQTSTCNDCNKEALTILTFQPTFSGHFFMTQCLQARQQQDFIEDPDEWTILTSFFLFAYHGNLDQSRSAWYYLREAIGFIQVLRLDEPDVYADLDSETSQRRRRLFWLLFITERAYAIQHRTRAVLRPTIDLPRVFESQDPKLAYGFVTLAKVFASVDEAFIAAWRDQPSSGTVEGVLSEIEETQRLDILITHYWLRVLVCQLQIEYSPHSLPVSDGSDTRCVLDTSRSLLHLISTASSISLESHGIGMEQKVSDVASCLCDIIAGLTANEFSTDFFSAPDFLHNFMVFLARFRNHESQYLRPLAQKATTVLAARLQPSSFPGATEARMANEEIASYEDESLWTKE